MTERPMPAIDPFEALLLAACQDVGLRARERALSGKFKRVSSATASVPPGSTAKPGLPETRMVLSLQINSADIDGPIRATTLVSNHPAERRALRAARAMNWLGMPGISRLLILHSAMMSAQRMDDTLARNFSQGQSARAHSEARVIESDLAPAPPAPAKRKGRL